MRKTIKKAIASIIATTTVCSTALSMMASSNAFADEGKTLNVSTEILSEAITVDGTVVPAGTVAITVNVSNNDGFKASATKLVMSTSDFLVDEDGNPIVITGELLSNSIISAAVKDNNIVVSTASAEEATEDGEMFTIFANSASSRISVYDISSTSVALPVQNTRDVYEYYIGDSNHNTYINSTDASNVLTAVQNYAGNIYGTLPVSVADASLSTYFPYLHYAAEVDTNKNGIINKKDSDNILDFYNLVSVGYSRLEALNMLYPDYNYCGEIVTVYE